MVGPNFKPPKPDAPQAWIGTTASQPAELAQWWRHFGDSTLDALVTEALAANLDLAVALTQLRQARATSNVAIGGLMPQVTASGSYQRVQAASASDKNRKPANTNPVQDLFLGGLDAVWELDLFGGQRRQVEATQALIQAATENLRDVQVSAIAEVALDYIQLRGTQQQIDIARRNLEAQQKTVDLTRQRLDVGFASALDVANAEATAATTAAQIPVLETSARQSIYALSLLLGRPPAELVERLSPTAALPTAPTPVPAGIPSDLLRRRADIRQAEAQLHAATAQIGVAIADFFPKFSLTGGVTWSNKLLDTWWTDASRSFSAGPAVTWPIFQGGAVLANVRLQEALKDQAYLTYRKTVLTAFQDVENALVALDREQRHRQLLAEAVAANRKAVELSLLLYTEGQTDFLSVLTAQRSLYSAEDALAQSERSLSVDCVALYKALGGGWEGEEKK